MIHSRRQSLLVYRRQGSPKLPRRNLPAVVMKGVETSSVTVIFPVVLGYGLIVSSFHVSVSAKAPTEHASEGAATMTNLQQHHENTEFRLALNIGKL